jgi:hypothetical protein
MGIGNNCRLSLLPLTSHKHAARRLPVEHRTEPKGTMPRWLHRPTGSWVSMPLCAGPPRERTSLFRKTVDTRMPTSLDGSGLHHLMVGDTLRANRSTVNLTPGTLDGCRGRVQRRAAR